MAYKFFERPNGDEDEGKIGVKPPTKYHTPTPFSTTLNPCPWAYVREEEEKEKEGEEEKGKGGNNNQ